MRPSVVCAVFLAMSFAGRSDAGDTAPKPFPVNRTQIVKDGTFYVDGRVRIAKGVEITVQKNTKIVSKDGEAVIELEGRLTVQGDYAARPFFEGVTVELQPTFEELRLNETEFRGKSCGGIVTKKDQPADGRIRLTDTMFSDSSTIKVELTNAATVDLRGLTFINGFDLKAVTTPGAKAHSVKLWMKECRANRGDGWRGMRVEGFSAVEIRDSEIGGDELAFIDCESVAVDACYLFCGKVGVVESVAGRFKNCRIQNCDLHCSSIALSAPEAPNPEKMKIENCWFSGESVVSAIKQKFIIDHDDDPKIGVIASVERPSAKALQLNWTIKR